MKESQEPVEAATTGTEGDSSTPEFFFHQRFKDLWLRYSV